MESVLRKRAEGTNFEILPWIDDCTRYILNFTAHHRITTPIFLAQFHEAKKPRITPVNTDRQRNGIHHPPLRNGRRGGCNAFEAELRKLNITQKNGAPNHPTTQGKVERFQQTLKKWLRAQPDQP